ncbi:MAG: C25 family cysteine peptidase, partial [Vicinamibacteria bacterium]
GYLEGFFRESGAAEAPASFVFDVTEEPLRIRGESVAGTVRFGAEAGRRYLLVSEARVLRPEVRRASREWLKTTLHSTDYLVVGPKGFLGAARPLVELRRSQGLAVKSVAIEDVYSEFGFGESRPEALRDFLSYAYHRWRKPPRYVVLLGDGTYDFKDHLGAGAMNRVPPLMVKTSYLWTASDPAYASVNGDDLLPDLALGRLPASSVEEVERIVRKILAYESLGAGAHTAAVLIADDSDDAGDFEGDADSLARGVLSNGPVRAIYLSRLGIDAAREEILESFDQGASTLSYVGHGGIHLWASENLFDLKSVGLLSPQPRQPIVLTMNCLNGYFHFPYFNSLAEELL